MSLTAADIQELDRQRAFVDETLETLSTEDYRAKEEKFQQQVLQSMFINAILTNATREI